MTSQGVSLILKRITNNWSTWGCLLDIADVATIDQIEELSKSYKADQRIRLLMSLLNLDDITVSQNKNVLQKFIVVISRHDDGTDVANDENKSWLQVTGKLVQNILFPESSHSSSSSSSFDTTAMKILNEKQLDESMMEGLEPLEMIFVSKEMAIEKEKGNNNFAFIMPHPDFLSRIEKPLIMMMPPPPPHSMIPIAHPKPLITNKDVRKITREEGQTERKRMISIDVIDHDQDEECRKIQRFD